ncbi:hypothetical protein GGR74_003240 [Xanthomonas arboricola]
MQRSKKLATPFAATVCWTPPPQLHASAAPDFAALWRTVGNAIEMIDDGRW